MFLKFNRFFVFFPSRLLIHKVEAFVAPAKLQALLFAVAAKTGR